VTCGAAVAIAAAGEAEVQRQTRHRKGGVAAVVRSQRGDEGRLRRPERATAEADEPVEKERLPRLVHERKEPDSDRHHAERSDQHAARPDPVRQDAREKARKKPENGVHGGDETRDPEGDPAHVVQVDDQERQDDPVPERVRESADLEDPDVAGQLRVQAAEIRPHEGRA